MFMNIYSERENNVRRTWLLMAVFFTIIILIGYFFSVFYDNQSILFVAIIFSVFMNFFSYWFSDKIVIGLTKARQVKNKSEYLELWNVVENLSITSGLKMPRVYIVDDPSPNAFATGRNEEKAVVAVTTGLLEILNKTELEGVVAHELSHIGNRDILLSTVVVVLVGLLTVLSDMFMRSSFRSRRSDNDRGGGLVFVIGVILVILSPIIGTIIKFAISRKREFLADASGALLTRYPEGLASALEKISSNSTPMKSASGATAHLFISNPFGIEKNIISSLFSTHPPIEERVKILRGLKNE